MANVVKIYQLSTLGYSELHTQLQQVSKDFASIKKAKQEAEQALATAQTAGDAAKYRAELQKIRVEMAEIDKQSKQLQADMKAEQLMRQADVNQQKQQIAQQKIANDAQKAANDQTKLNMQAQALAARAAQSGINAQIGSYAALVQEAKQFYALLKNTPKGGSLTFQGQLFSYDEAIAKYKELSAAEQEFRRQFTQDKTLVGEYTTGIVQAFKAMGLDDLIGGQVTRANERLGSLTTEAKELKNAFQQIKQQGQTGFDELNNRLNAMATSAGGLDARFVELDSILRQSGTDGAAALQLIEQRLIANATEAGTLRQQVTMIQNELRGTGDIGSRITASLSNGFKEVTSQVRFFVVSYFGVQAAIQGVMSTFDKTVQLDSLHAAMQVVSKDATDLATNERFLQEITNRLGLEYLGTAQAFKSFYASSTQAGIGADQTRQIFEAATTASARLKLSQDQTNGVLLAFGQIASKGKVQAEELRGQIGERLPGAFAIAARAMGVTQAQLNKMMDTGQLAANDFLPKFAAELQRTFGGDTTKNIDGLQATINRFSNQFTKFLNDNNAAIAAFLTGVIGLLSVLTGLVSVLPTIIGLVTLYAAGWALANKAIVIQRAELLLLNAQLFLGRVALLALTLAEYAFNAALLITNGIIRTVTLTMNLFGLSMGALPIKVVIGLLVALAATFTAMAQSTSKAAANMRTLTASQLEAIRTRKALSDVQNEALKLYQKETIELNRLYSAAVNANLPLETRKNAIQKLIDQFPAYFGNLNAETATVDQLSEAYKKLSDNIMLNARVQASAQLSANRQERANSVAAIMGEIETNFQAGVRKIAINDENKDVLLQALSDAGIQAEEIDKTGITFFAKDKDKLIAALDKERAARQTIADKYNGIASGYAAQQAGLQKIKEEAAKAALIGRINNRDVTAAEVEALIKSTQAELDALKLNDPKRKELIDKIAAYQKILDDANGKQKKIAADKLTTDERNEGNSLDAQLKNEIARLELEFAELRKNHELSVDEEIDYLTRLNAINNHYAQLKIAAIHGNNAAEKAARAELNKQMIDNDIDTANKVKDIYKKDFDNRAALLKQSTEATIAQIKEGLSEFENTPTVSHTARAQATSDANDLILQETIRYYNQLESLALKDKQKIEGIEQEKQKAIADIMKQGTNDQKAINDANIEDIQDRGQISIDIRKKQYAEIRTEILNNTALTEEQRQQQLAIFQKAEEREVAAIELDVLNKIVAFKKGLFAKGLISEAEYDAVLALQQQKAEEVTKLTTENIAKNLDTVDLSVKGFMSTLSKLLDTQDFFNQEIGKSGISLGYVLSQSFDLAKSAMNDYFDAQANRINQDKELQLKRLGIEEEQVKAHAQSTAEQESLDKQYQDKKDAITKAAGEKLKKQKKAEVLIALAAEEANIAVQAAANPLNAVTFGGAGLTQFAILSGIALAKAALQIAAINSQQFAFGGDVPSRGGKFGGKPHAHGGTPFGFQGQQFEAEVDELAIVRTKDAPRNKVFQLTGTHTEIASALNRLGGGIDFNPGARIKKFAQGGNISSLNPYPAAPQFTPASYFVNNNNDSGAVVEKLEEMNQKLDAHAKATSERIDRLEVVQVTSSVTAAQKKAVQQASIGTLGTKRA